MRVRNMRCGRDFGFLAQLQLQVLYPQLRYSAEVQATARVHAHILSLWYIALLLLLIFSLGFMVDALHKLLADRSFVPRLAAAVTARKTAWRPFTCISMVGSSRASRGTKSFFQIASLLLRTSLIELCETKQELIFERMSRTLYLLLQMPDNSLLHTEVDSFRCKRGYVCSQLLVLCSSFVFSGNCSRIMPRKNRA